ncbi:transmembrane protein [Pimephales promelas]|nr:transmembrane protein [Pimephales promelas]
MRGCSGEHELKKDSDQHEASVTGGRSRRSDEEFGSVISSPTLIFSRGSHVSSSLSPEWLTPGLHGPRNNSRNYPCGLLVFHGASRSETEFPPYMLQTNNYSLVLLIQLALLTFDLFVNSFSELLRAAPVIQLVLFIIQDIGILFNVIIILLMMFNTYVFQVGLVSLLLERFRALLILSALYLTLSICFHCWVMNLRWMESNRFVWTDGLQVLFVFQRLAAVLYYYFYKRTTEYLGDPRLYEDSPWLRDAFARARQ